MTCVYERYEIKIKMVKEQLLQLKMKFLLGYNLKIGIQLEEDKKLVGEFTGGVGKIFQVGRWANFRLLVGKPWHIHCIADSCCENITGGVDIRLYGCVNLLAYLSYVFVYVWYQIRVLAKNHIMC